MGLRVFVMAHNGSILPLQQGLPKLVDIGHHCDSRRGNMRQTHRDMGVSMDVQSVKISRLLLKWHLKY